VVVEMTKEDIIRMAREAGFAEGVAEIVGLEGFANFASLVAAVERDRFCAALRQLHDAYSCASNPAGLKE
jgi:hypothetical protein